MADLPTLSELLDKKLPNRKPKSKFVSAWLCDGKDCFVVFDFVERGLTGKEQLEKAGWLVEAYRSEIIRAFCSKCRKTKSKFA